jgi:MerR family transcriptional regulator, light-induced transcriptional regulator
VKSFVGALLASDHAAAAAVLLGARARLRTRVAVVSDLFQPALERIGELWYEGKIGVADEHRATAIVEELLFGLAATPSRHPVSIGATCLLAAVGEEQHEIGLRALQLALEDDGWSCDLLGATMPMPEVVRIARRSRPRIAMLSASYLPDVSEIGRTIDELHQVPCLVMAGGAAFDRVDGLWRRIHADAYAPDARIAIRMARRLIHA